jgi:hypothetical protein
MKLTTYPRLLLPADFDQRAAFEITLKGWLSAQVETEEGARYPVYFSDPVRLQQDLEEAQAQGAPCFAEPGLIILPEVTVEAAEQAVQHLWQHGFFAWLRAESRLDSPSPQIEFKPAAA